jgi:hypothetical protein
MKIFVLALFSALSSLLYSQGNLQFNQVISNAGSTSTSNVGYSTYNSIAYTVPAGKVWKLEYVFGMNSGWYVTVNNKVIYYTNISGQPLERQSPIWLKAGDILKLSSIYNAYDFYFSGIEFNIIP